MGLRKIEEWAHYLVLERLIRLVICTISVLIYSSRGEVLLQSMFIPRHEVRLVIMLPSWVGRSNWVDGRSYWVERRSYWVASSQIGSPDGRIGLFPDY